MNRPDDVAIFWDYENCPVPTNSTGCTIANSITTLSRPFGSVKLFRAYLEITAQLPLSRFVGLRAELQSSGVSLIDCPHNGRKEVADKMILVDMLAFALDNPTPCTIIIISGDRDFGYALSVLKLRRYRMVLVTTANAHTTLTTQASICFDWSAAILNPPTNTSSSNYRTTSGRQASRHTHSRGSSGEVSSPPEYALHSPNAPFAAHTPEPDNSTNHGIPVTQTAFAGRYSSQFSVLERRQADSVTPTSHASRCPSFLSNGTARNLPVPVVGLSSASPAEATGTPSIGLTELPSTTPNVAPTSAGKPQKQTPDTVLSTPSRALQGESSSYLGLEPSTQETFDEHLSSSADSTEEIESSSSTAASIEQPSSSGSEERADTPSLAERVVEPEVTHSTSPPQTQNIVPDALSGRATSSRNAGVPAFSLAAMARLQGIDYSQDKESIKSDTAVSAKSVSSEQPPLPTSPIPQDTNVSTSPPSSVIYTTAPQSPEPEAITLSVPDRTACPSPSTSTSSQPPSRILPPEFLTLVQSLKTCIAHGHHRPLITEVALQTPQFFWAHGPAGVASFGQNVSMAVKAGIIEMGGPIDKPWISLKPEWYNVQPAFNPPVPSSVPTQPLPSLSVSKADEGVATSLAQTKPAASPSAPVAGLQVIPPHFDILVLTLQELRKEGELWPLRSHIAMLVSKNEETDTCKRAGVADFDQYVELAHSEGIIATGGKEDQTWIGLCRKWYDAVPATVAEEIGKESKTSDIPPIPTPRNNKASLPEQVPPVVKPNISATAVPSSSTYSSVLRAPLPASQPEHSIDSTRQPLSSNRPKPPLANPAIPIANFFILVRVLREHKMKGQLRLLRSSLPKQIGQNGETYRKAGVEKFNQYIDMAVSLGIVNVGVHEGEAWVELHPHWQNALPVVT